MKIFWSWQSDTPGNIGRFFVRDALNAAIDQLKQNDEIVEPAEREALSAMHLDQDRKGIPGSPDLARVILEKIESSAVFVADVTPVGFVVKTSDNQGGEVTTEVSKKLINSNVAIELGYALRALTDRALLMVMNGHYANREDLPFDLKHKAGPITFNLAPDADRAAIKAASQKLTPRLVEALKLCIAAKVEEDRRQTPFPEAQSAPSAATFFAHNEVLAAAGYPGEQEFRFEADKGAYLRLFPAHSSSPVGLALMNKLFEARKPCPMSMTVGGVPGRNKYGPIIFDFEGKTTITALTQGFVPGELWGVNSKIIQIHGRKNSRTQKVTITSTLPMISFEKLYVRVLNNYLNTATELGLPPPYTVVLGISGLADTYLTAPGGELGNGQFFGPVMTDSIERRYTLTEVSDAAIADLLRRYFAAIYDLAAASRRDILTDPVIAAHNLPPR
jgi:hypothetical protein